MSENTAHCFCQDALAKLDAVATAERVRRKEIRSEEAVAAAVARARAVEPSIHAVVVDRYEAAIAEAASEPVGAFAGTPTFIKDMIDVAGLPTRFGSEGFRNVVPAATTDPFAQQMLDLGMIALGKSSMPEMGFTPSTEFPQQEATRNPWNLDHSAGGSSGGAAALVAAGVVPIAHAADGGGSIRIPAAACGLVGLKPSRGRLAPSASTAHQGVGIVVDGVVSRSVRDTALYYAEAEKHFRNPKLRPIGHVTQPLDRALRITATTHSPARGETDAATLREFDATLRLLESLGHRVVQRELPIPDSFAEDFLTYWSFLSFGLLKAGRRAVNPRFEADLVTDFTKGLAASFKPRWTRLPAAIVRLRKSAARYAELFQDTDVVLTPTVGQLTPPIGHLHMGLPFDELQPRVEEWTRYTPYANGTGAPSISLPLGHDAATHLPVGMMFGANHGEERLLLELALQLEAAQPWKTIA